LATAIVCHCARQKKRKSPATIPVAIGGVLLACLLLAAQLHMVYTPAMQAVGEKRQITASVEGLIEHSHDRYYYQIRLKTIDGAPVKNTRARLSGREPLYCDPYDIVRYTGALYVLGADEDQQASYRAKGIYLGSYAQDFSEDPFVTTATHAKNPMKYVILLRAFLFDRIHAAFDGQGAAILAGMLLGDTSGISRLTKSAFRNAGLSHIFAVSGIHMQLLGWSLHKLLLRIKLPKRVTALLSGCFVLLFMALTGFTSSCVRSGVMMLVLLCGECFSRRAEPLNSMGIAAVLLLIQSPLAAGQISLQLSFSATLGVLTLAKPIQTAVCKNIRHIRCNPVRNVVNKAASLFAMTLSASACTLPVLLLRMSSGFTPIALFSNIVLLPLASGIILLGAVTIFLSGVPFLGESIVTNVQGLLDLFLFAVGKTGELPVPILQTLTAGTYVAFGILALSLAAVFLIRYFSKTTKLPVLGICAAYLFCFWMPALIRRNDVWLHVLPVENGMSVLIADRKRAAVFACGGDDLPQTHVTNTLSAHGKLRLDYLVLPSDDPQMSSGAKHLMREVPVRQVFAAYFDPFAAHDAEAFTMLPFGATQLPRWDNTAAAFFNDGVTRACYVQAYGVRVLIVFGGEAMLERLPIPWRDYDIFLSAQNAGETLRITPRGAFGLIV
jgi:competence protein ComEC